MTQRATWDETWDNVAQTLRWRSLCSRSRVAAVITDARHRVVSTGYNGPPAGFVHSDLPCDQWCPRGAEGDDAPLCMSVHAEANALISGDRSSWQGGTMYVTKHPCLECAKMIANSGLDRLFVSDERMIEGKHAEVYKFLMEECGIKVELNFRLDSALVIPLKGV